MDRRYSGLTKRFHPVALVVLFTCAVSLGVLEKEPAPKAPDVALAAAHTHNYKVLDTNIHGVEDKGTPAQPNPNPIGKVVSQLTTDTAIDVALLQEVCENQFTALDNEPSLSSWNWAFAPRSPSPRFPGSHLDICPAGAAYGNVVGSKFPINNPTVTELFQGPSYYADCNQSPACHTDYPMLCVDLGVGHSHGPSSVAACSVHLMAGWNEASPGPEVRPYMTNLIRTTLGTRIANAQSVILGGDFNMGPLYPEMSQIYDLTTAHAFGGPGQFHEGDQLDTGTPKRSAEATATDGFLYPCGAGKGGPRVNKFDYVFFSGNRTPGGTAPAYPDRLDSIVVENNCSDHEVVLAKATVEFD